MAHVTLRVRERVYQLRSRRMWRAIEKAFREGRERHGLRLVHYSVQRDHLHMVVEAEGAKALSRGMQGIGIRMARGLNRVMRQPGRVFADRYHAHLLHTPMEVRNALLYVLNNAKKHAPAGRRPVGHDPFSSAAWFDGWSRPLPLPWPVALVDGTGPPTVEARSWLLRWGWRTRHGPLDPEAVPG